MPCDWRLGALGKRLGVHDPGPDATHAHSEMDGQIGFGVFLVGRHGTCNHCCYELFLWAARYRASVASP